MKTEFIRAGVIGHKISYSKSPIIHGHWIKKYGPDHGFNGEYTIIEIEPGHLETGVQNLVDEGFAGFNITVPHKEGIYKLCDDLNEAAKAVRAVNTVKIVDGKLHGSNTDVYGFIGNIEANAPDFDFKAGKAIVLGAGGSTRAVLQGLIEKETPEILILNRTKANAEKLREECSDPSRVVVGDWDQRSDLLGGANLLVNTTPLGKTGEPPLEIDLQQLPVDAVVNDINYDPVYSDLLLRARERGNVVVNGNDMLVQQARPGFQKWFGVWPEPDETLEALLK